MYKIKLLKSIKRQIHVPADKSISHRAIILSSLAKGPTHIFPLLLSEDTRATLKCIKRCGVRFVSQKEKRVFVMGEGLYYPKKRTANLNAQESGTTFRIFSGVLAGQKFPCFFDAKPALKKRPMARIIEPLLLMGANIQAKTKKGEKYPPFIIEPAAQLRGIKYRLPVASAQVKSAILLTGLYANSKTSITEPYSSRDHTERMLSVFGAKIVKKANRIDLLPTRKLNSPGQIFIPSDFSSASFFIVLGLILKDSEILITDVNINPTRSGLLKVLRRMGADIKTLDMKDYFEPYCNILAKSSQLKATTVTEKEIPSLIDEVPILCVAAAFAKGKTKIFGTGELIVKETNRVKAIIYNLKKAGAKITSKRYNKNGKVDWCIEITGAKSLKGTNFKSFGDHRTAMSAIILGSAIGNSRIDNTKCINKSFPGFISKLSDLR